MRTAATFARTLHGKAVFFRSRLLAAGAGAVAFVFGSPANTHVKRRVAGSLVVAVRALGRSFARRYARGVAGAKVTLLAAPHVRRTAGPVPACLALRGVEIPHVKRRAPAVVSLAIAGRFAAGPLRLSNKTFADGTAANFADGVAVQMLT